MTPSHLKTASTTTPANTTTPTRDEYEQKPAIMACDQCNGKGK